MADDLENHFLAIVMLELPKNAEVHVRRESGDICIYVDWKLGNDPERPTKRSKKIRMCISRAAIDDYNGGSERSRGHADDKLRRIVATRIREFDAEHNVPAQTPVPVEQWTVTTEMLNA